MKAKHDLLELARPRHLLPSHRILLACQLAHIDFLDRAIANISTEIARRLRPFEAGLHRLEQIPGIGRRLAEVIASEIGAEKGRFPSAKHLASWAGMCPGNNESAGKRLSGKTRKGSPWLRSALVEAAHAAIRSQETYLSAQYHRLAARKGSQKAVVAVAHSLLVIVFHVCFEEQEYHELGGHFFDERDRQAVQKRLVHRLEQLGYQVTLQGAPVA